MDAEVRNRQGGIYWLRVAGIVILVAVFLAIAVFAFHVHTEGRFALREAKNIRLALITADIEFYPAGKTVYAADRVNGLADGVKAKLKRYAGVDEGVTIHSYDRSSRTVKKFTYTTDRYLVTYTYDGKEETWTVDYLWRLFFY